MRSWHELVRRNTDGGRQFRAHSDQAFDLAGDVLGAAERTDAGGDIQECLVSESPCTSSVNSWKTAKISRDMAL
jgi:hypothetical protein